MPGTAKQWIARRVELNAFAGPDLIRYIEGQLAAAGVRPKVIPDEEALPELAESEFREVLDDVITEELDDLIDRDNLTTGITDPFVEQFTLDGVRDHIQEDLAKQPTLSWRTSLQNLLRKRVDLRRSDVRDAVRNWLQQRAEGA